MLPVYRGVKHQYGYGLGSISKTALKTFTPLIKPLVKSGLNAVKKEGIKQGIPLSCTPDHSHSPLYLAQKVDHHHVVFCHITVTDFLFKTGVRF